MDDALLEVDETVEVSVSGGSGYTINSPNSADIKIIDNDGAVVTIEATDPWAREEGTNSAEFTVRRTGILSSDLTVNYVVGGSATDEDDYDPLGTGSGWSVTIPSGSATATILVETIDDSDVEGTEEVTLSLTSGGGYQVGSEGSDTAFIFDDDLVVSVTATDASASEDGPGTGAFTISRNSTLGVLTVFYYVDGTATPASGSWPGDYIDLPYYVDIPSGQSSVVVTVSPVDDSLEEGNEVVRLTLLPDEYEVEPTAAVAAVRIHDDESGSGGSGGNSPPVAVDDSASLSEETLTEIPVLDNDSDPDADPLTVTSVSEPQHGTVVIAWDGQSVWYAPDESYVGEDSFTYTVTDHFGGTDVATVFIDVVENTAPTITSPGNQTDAEGDAVGLAITASDSENDPLTFTATGLPAGLQISELSGEISGIIDSSAADASPYTVTVTVSDGRLTDSATFSWTVTDTNDAPFFSRLDDRRNRVGDTVSVQLQGYDPDGDALTYETTGYDPEDDLIYEVTGLPDGLTISPGGQITGTVGAIGSSASSEVYSVTVKVKDATHEFVSGIFDWTVVDTSEAPVVSFRDLSGLEFSRINQIDADLLRMALDQENGTPPPNWEYVPELDYLLDLAEQGAYKAVVVDGAGYASDHVIFTTEGIPVQFDVGLTSLGGNTYETFLPIISYSGTMTTEVAQLFLDSQGQDRFILLPSGGETTVSYVNTRNQQAQQQKRDLVMLSLGDSLTAGVSHGVLAETLGQAASFPVMVAKKLGIKFNYSKLASPLLPEVDYYGRWIVADYVGPPQVPVLTYRPNTSTQGTRAAGDNNTKVHNFGVAGALISELGSAIHTGNPAIIWKPTGP